jgi:hypothetical protein
VVFTGARFHNPGGNEMALPYRRLRLASVSLALVLKHTIRELDRDGDGKALQHA